MIATFALWIIGTAIFMLGYFLGHSFGYNKGAYDVKNGIINREKTEVF